MYRYRHRYAKGSCPKRDIQVKVCTFVFGSALEPFNHSDGVVHRCRLGSDAGRSVSPYPGSENGNASDHSAPLPPSGPKKKGRPPKNKPKGTTDVVVLLCMRGSSRYFYLLQFLLRAMSMTMGTYCQTENGCAVFTLLPLWITD